MNLGYGGHSEVWMSRPLVVVLVSVMACAKPPEAPEDLDALTHYLIREWNNEDPAVMEAGVANLMAFLDGVDLDREVSVQDRAWEITSLAEEDVEDIDHPGRDPSITYGVGVAMASNRPIEDHVSWQLQSDLVEAEPTAVQYDRDWEDDTELCFGDRGCPVLLTVNEIERQNLLMSLAFTYHKHFRWVEMEDGQAGMISRGWITESVEGAQGRSQLWQTYNVEAWLPDGDRTRRYQVLWAESDIAGASDAIQIATVKTSTNGHFLANDEALEALLD